MTDLNHELAVEFPDQVEKMEALKASDESFAKLFDAYHEINAKVIAAETLEHPTDHFHEEDLKKQRANLKDEIYKRLAG
ncbi:MAG TPA: DUF465 domain-containing protein [Rhodobacterales bacterium]|nr:DUF465 domain-containing protein [Rhodobacterales bacterium]